MAGIGDLFNKLLSGLKDSPEAKENKNTSMNFGSYMGAEISLVIFFLALAALVVLMFQADNFTLAIILLGVSTLFLVVSVPIAFKIRKESSSSFSMMGFYIVLSLAIVCALSVWRVL